MLPIRDHTPSLTTPWVTYTLIAVNIAVFLGTWPLMAEPRALHGLLLHWALIPAAISDGQQLHGLVTSIFLHGGFLHLAGNMLFLWIFGDNLEDAFGHAPFLGFYLACGVLAGLAQTATGPHSIVPMVGASGAIAGVMGGYLLLFPRARVDVLFIFFIFIRIFAVPAGLVLAVWFGFQLLLGVSAGPAAGGVAHWAHVGGFLVGVALTLPLWHGRGGAARWRRAGGRPEWPEAAPRRTRIPRAGRRS